MPMEEEDDNINGHKPMWAEYLTKYGFLVVGLLIMFLFQGQFGMREFDNAFLIGGGIVGVGVLANLAYNLWLNSTAKVVFNWGHSTTDGEIISVGNYSLIRPAVRAFGLYWKLPGAYIVPADAPMKEGPNIALRARMEQVELEEIPDIPQSFIIKNNIKPPYFIGWCNEEQLKETVEIDKSGMGTETISVAYMATEIKEQAKQISFLRKLANDKMKDVEEMMEWGQRITGKKSFTDKIKDTFTDAREKIKT